ncbi:MAG: FkbM family methyltransferase [Acidobacteria bacterium]|nr:FkbM family methyltransferase [Acidobacteriota bacterium]
MTSDNEEARTKPRGPLVALPAMLQRLVDTLTGGAHIRRLRRRIDKLETTSKAFRIKTKAEHEKMKRVLGARRRRILSPAIVRALLPLRARTLQARAAAADAPREDARLQERAPDYGQALVAADEQNPELVKAAVQGLVWWVPVQSSITGAARERFIAKQLRFPYRNITQTREFSQGLVMLDIGANTGRMSIPRVILGDVVRAYCAEPDPLNYAALVRNVVDNGLRGLVLPDLAAIGSVSGRARLQHAKYAGGHRLVPDSADLPGIDVASWRLDDWVARMSIDPLHVAYVKVDTQGWEAHVLRGAPDLLAHQHITWQLEVSPAMLDAAGTPPPELFGICQERFSHFVDLDKRVGEPRARPTVELEQTLSYLDGTDGQTDILLFNADPATPITEDDDDE